MAFELKRHKNFIKDLRNAKMSDKEFRCLIEYLALLSANKALPPEARDHALVGEWQGYREFHIGGDKLVIYKIKANELLLARLGTHNQLFKSE